MACGGRRSGDRERENTEKQEKQTGVSRSDEAQPRRQ